jgi:hypothetical protein
VSRHLAFLAVLGLGSSVLAAEPLALQMLTPTSGTGAELLLDGNPATGWRPEGDPAEEGVLLRFEQPVKLDGVALRACPDSALLDAALYMDGALLESTEKVGAADVPLRVAEREARSVFIRVTAASTAKPCLAEVTLLQRGKPLALKPPRTVAGRVEASSVLTPADAYHPGYLFDGRTDFGWVEGAKGTGAGESLTLTLEAPVELVALELWNGYQRSADHFQKNARAKRLTVAVDGGEPVGLDVKDASGPQRLKLPAPMKGRAWKLTVESVFPGKRYPDLVLSELRLVDAQGSLGVRTPDMDERKKAFQQELSATALAKVVDRRWRGACASGEGAVWRTLKLRSNHTFVLYDDTEGVDGEPSVSEVLDGAWVVKKTGKPWSTVELFGRRHRNEKSWEPYGDSKSRETVRIAGGKLEVARVADLGREAFIALMNEWLTGPLSARAACLEVETTAYDVLAKEGAFIVRGTALTDIFVLN